jgi:hypothetical protein
VLRMAWRTCRQHRVLGELSGGGDTLQALSLRGHMLVALRSSAGAIIPPFQLKGGPMEVILCSGVGRANYCAEWQARLAWMFTP